MPTWKCHVNCIRAHSLACIGWAKYIYYACYRVLTTRVRGYVRTCKRFLTSCLRYQWRHCSGWNMAALVLLLALLPLPPSLPSSPCIFSIQKVHTSVSLRATSVSNVVAARVNTDLRYRVREWTKRSRGTRWIQSNAATLTQPVGIFIPLTWVLCAIIVNRQLVMMIIHWCKVAVRLGRTCTIGKDIAGGVWLF